MPGRSPRDSRGSPTSFSAISEGAGPIARNIGPDRTEALRTQLGLDDADAVFFVCGIPKDFIAFAAAARLKIGRELGLAKNAVSSSAGSSTFRCTSSTRRPGKSISATTRSRCRKAGSQRSSGNDPLTITAYQYDIVCNGVELSSGAIRNHRPDIMYKAFAIAGYSASEVEARFSGMLNAFKYGAPPHGGSAPGIDRIVMLLANTPNLREVVAFPMNQQAQDLLMQAPAPVPPERLRELHSAPRSAAVEKLEARGPVLRPRSALTGNSGVKRGRMRSASPGGEIL